MVLLQVKWKGYEDPADLTWELERVLRYVYHTVPLRRVVADLLTFYFLYVEVLRGIVLEYLTWS